jgi:hypothetical protein
MNQIPLLHIIIYSFTLWFGFYLIARDFRKAGLLFAGLGLVSYAMGLALTLLLRDTAQAAAWYYLPITLPTVFWMGATVYLVPDVPIRPINLSIVLAMLVVVIVVFATALVNPDTARWLGFALPLMFLAGTLIRIRQAFDSDLPRRPLVLLGAATLFFGLSSGLIVFPIEFIAQDWVVLAISFDVVLLGYTVGVLDAYDEGTSLLEDALRSLTAATLALLLFGGQVILVMAITEDASLPMLLLLFGLVTSLLLALAFYDSIQSLLDSIVFVDEPSVKAQRDELRAASSALARVPESATLKAIDEKEFVRLTRRALSHYSDLNKLASNPLVQLPLLEERIDNDNVLARANALKNLLRESIDHLKPDEEIDFASTDEWRYYNVLYFPYIAGLKPYSRRFYRDGLEPAEIAALDWFRTYVPERTLYNWQRTAAQLVAHHLREQLVQVSA